MKSFGLVCVLRYELHRLKIGTKSVPAIKRKDAIPDMSQKKLQERIIELSEAKDFAAARLEWEVSGVYEIEQDEELEACLCGYPQIRHVCEIRNKQNGNMAIVGNSCVSRFLGPHNRAITEALARIIKDPTRPLNAAVLDFLHERKVISPCDYEASIRSTRKRKLTTSLRELRTRVNSLAITYFRRRDPDVRALATQQSCDTAAQCK